MFSVAKVPPLLCLLLAGACARADDLLTKIDVAPRSEFWLATGFATAHFNRDKDLNGSNTGYGAEYHFSTTMRAAAGHFYNSDRGHSTYAGMIWQPYAIGPLRLGATVAVFNGYPRVRGGGWFPAVIPTMTLDYRRVGVNIGVVPSLGNRLYGGVSVQLRLKIFD
jgi:hypothetical protein